MANPYSTHLSYYDGFSWTTEKGASKFISELIETTQGIAGDNGCVLNGFYVSQSTGMRVNILPQAPGETQLDGHCLIKYNDYAFIGWLENSYQLTLAASSSSGSRYSYVVAYVDNSVTFDEQDHEIEAPGVLKFVEVPGTVGSTPARPTTAQIQAIVGEDNPYIILAEILVGVGVSAITQADITDLRQRAVFTKNIDHNPNQLIYIDGFKDVNSGNYLRFCVLEPGQLYPTAQAGEQIICIVLKDAS